MKKLTYDRYNVPEICIPKDFGPDKTCLSKQNAT